MLKKIICMTLLLCICFSFCSCGLLIGGAAVIIGQKLKDKEQDSEVFTGEEMSSETLYPPSETAKTDGYADIERVDCDSFKDIHISVDNDNIVLKTSVPKDIYLVRSNDGFELIRNNEKIGYISRELPEEISNSSEEFSDTYGYSEAELYYSINLLPDGNYVHYCRYEYNNEYEVSRTLHLTVNYRELDRYAVNKLCYAFSAQKSSTTPNTANKLSDSVIERGARIAILGNSFISTSKIGASLRDMLEYRHYVEDISIGYATVSKTYSVDYSLLQDIADGSYDAVFICGFYSADDATALEEVVRYCGYSDTKLFIFPAHNENESVIESAVSQYNGDVGFLDWKGEIDLLIGNGVSRSDFCINDQHQHSTPLAGYVGANMIYRTLFGEVPTADVYTAISQSEVEDKLGDYVNTGMIEIIDDSTIFRIY